MATMYMSPVEAIDRLVLHPITANRPVAAVKAVRVDGITLLVDAKGKVYSSQAHRRKGAYVLGINDTTRSTMRALKMLGVITQAQLDQHVKAGEAAQARREARWAANNVVSSAAAIGIKLTAAQLRKVEAAR